MPYGAVKSVKANYEELAPAWHDSQQFSPAPRHRRRLILNLVRPLDIRSVLEIGCGQSYILSDIAQIKKIKGTGSDISKSLIEANRKEFPEFKFEVLDIVKASLPEKYDLVIASEVLEHVSDYEKALENMAKMASKYILITVPSSQVFPIDRSIGHYRHYAPEDMTKPLEKLGFKTVTWYKWGFPFHNFYKHAINTLGSPESMRQKFGESSYSWSQKLVANFIYLLFFFNLKRWGYQLVILAEKK